MSSASATSDRSLLLELSLIRLDGETQSRVGLNESAVAEYAALMADNIPFPPIRVWFDGEYYWLADGFHRVEAARRAGLGKVAVEIRSGTLQDAQWDSFGANATNGLRRTKADMEIVISRTLMHQRALGLSINHLARHIGIPESTLRRWKKLLSSQVGEDADRVRVVTRNGVKYHINTKNIGSRGPVAPALRAGHRLAKDLEAMKSAATNSETRRVLAIIDKWFSGILDQRGVVEALNRTSSSTHRPT